MRGALARAVQGDKDARIIPADAGSTSPKAATSMRSWDHPRGCGEHQTTHRKPHKRVGSSPRMRGALISEKVV